MTRAREPPLRQSPDRIYHKPCPTYGIGVGQGEREGKMTYQEKRQFIRAKTTHVEAALYEQLAEECAELCQAALKMARSLRGDNPTPIKWGEAHKAIEEEYTDVELCADILGLKSNPYIATQKLDRWVERIKEKEEE